MYDFNQSKRKKKEITKKYKIKWLFFILLLLLLLFF